MAKELIGANEVARRVGVSIITFNRWYLWWDSDLPKPEGIKLPEYIREGNGRARKWRPEDVYIIRRFQKELPRGAMAEFNAAYSWGVRGDRALIKKQTSSAEIKHILRGE